MNISAESAISALLEQTRALCKSEPGPAVRSLGVLVDACGAASHAVGLQDAIALSEGLSKRKLTTEELARLHYFRGNAFSLVAKLEGPDARDGSHAPMEKAIYQFRVALREPYFEALESSEQSCVLTNLGNMLHHVGRHVEAIEYWGRVLAKDESFSMAQGNRGGALSAIAPTLPSRLHAIVYLRHAERDLETALAAKGPRSEARQVFAQNLDWVREIRRRYDTGQEIDLDGHSLGKSKIERAYRTWCLKERLFLNPINDLGMYSIGARDELDAPSIVVKIDEGPHYPGLYSQLKQEFSAARYFYYQGRFRKQAHFSDRSVRTYNTLDYPAYGLGVEELKASFRTAYSLLDKVAYFLNDYLRLGFPPDGVSFRTIWYIDGKRDRGMRPEFVTSTNRSLQGLRWVAKDIGENRVEFRDAMEPDAREIQNIRNALEHRYLKLHMDPWAGPQEGREQPFFKDKLAYSMRLSEFEARALRLLKIARAALMYLSFAITIEERARAKDRKDKVGRQFLDIWEDSWKVR